MNKKNILLVILLILVIALSAFAIYIGMNAIKSDKGASNNKGDLEDRETFSLTLDDMYCNIKNSKRIVKVNLSIETYNEKNLDLLKSKEYLIRDNINQIIRNKTEEELEGKDGQLMLQEEVKNALTNLFDEDSIANIYFNDFVIQ